jgi:hypothetical protein
MSDQKLCYRYVTPVLRGAWQPTETEALCEALNGGQAFYVNGRITLFEFARIESRPQELCGKGSGRKRT